MSESKEERDYIAVNVPRKTERYFDELLENPEIQKKLELANLRKTHSGLGRWIICQFLIENTGYRYQHLNTKIDRATIMDLKTRRIFEILFEHIGESEFQMKCELCRTTQCEHIEYAKTLPEIMEPIKEKGLKYRE